jgi:hypothetical protein
MAYFIFLKFLDSLEDFRKNSHVKIPPKSPSTNFQSLDIFKNQIFYSEKNFSFTFGPIGPAASRPIRPFAPAAAHLPSLPRQPTGQSAQWPLAGLPSLPLSSLADVRAPPGHLLPQANRRCRRPRPVHCRPRLDLVHRPWTESTDYSIQNNSVNPRKFQFYK